MNAFNDMFFVNKWNVSTASGSQFRQKGEQIKIKRRRELREQGRKSQPETFRIVNIKSLLGAYSRLLKDHPSQCPGSSPTPLPAILPTLVALREQGLPRLKCAQKATQVCIPSHFCKWAHASIQSRPLKIRPCPLKDWAAAACSLCYTPAVGDPLWMHFSFKINSIWLWIPNPSPCLFPVLYTSLS